MFIKIPFIMPCVIGCLIFTFHANAYDCLKQAEKDQLWADAEKSLLESGHLLYRDHTIGVARAMGYVTANEAHFYHVDSKMNHEGGDVYLGFGSVINFNLLGARSGVKTSPTATSVEEKTRTAIFADISADVNIAMHSFWRTIWLVSETPQQWLANIAGFSINEHASLPDIFHSIANKGGQPRYRYNESSIGNLDTQLKTLVVSGQISDAARRFTLAVIQEEENGCNKRSKTPHENDINIFKIARGAATASCVQSLYDPTMIWLQDLSSLYPTLTDSVAILNQAISDLKSISFLDNIGAYKRVRRIFQSGKDHYAQANLMDTRLWTEVGNFARKEKSAVTDIYTTCIPHCLAAVYPGCNAKTQFRAEARKLPMTSTGIQIIESHCAQTHPEMIVEQLLPISNSTVGKDP